MVRVTAPSIDGGGAAPALTLDGDALAMVAVDDGWAEYRLPADARGDVTLELGGPQPDSFDVEVLGFRWVQALGLSLHGNLLLWPRTGSASLLGLNDEGGDVMRILPASLDAQVLVSGPTALARSVGPTADPDVVLIPRGTPEVWRLSSTPHVIDTLSVPFSRHAMLLSDSVYVFSGHHTISAMDPRVGSPFQWDELYEESQGTVVSPSGRYGAVRVYGSELGPPVFSSESGQPVFHVDTLFRSYGVDFSPVGDTLYIAGVTRSPDFDNVVLAVDAATGSIIDGIDVGAFEPLNLVRDRSGPWLFVMAGVPDAPPALLVIDSRSMQVVGNIATSDAFADCHGGCEGTVAVGSDGVFFVTSGGPRTDPAHVLAFDGWPVHADP